jgi:hypothetical protein
MTTNKTVGSVDLFHRRLRVVRILATPDISV